MRLTNVIKSDLLNIFTLKKFLSIILIFISVALLTISEIEILLDSYKFGLWDILFITFSGPLVKEFTIMDIAKFIIPQVFLFYILANFINSELKERNNLILPRIKSLSLWWTSKIITMMILTFIYYLLGFIIVGVIGKIYVPFYTNFGDLFLLFGENIKNINITYTIISIFLLLWILSFFMGLLQLTISIVLKNPMPALIISIILEMFSICVGYIDINLIKWFPVNQGIFIRHNFTNCKELISFKWSYIYLAIGICLLICVVNNYIKRKEIIY